MSSPYDTCPRCYGANKCSEHSATVQAAPFHTHDGWCFARLPDGSVELTRRLGPDPQTGSIIEGPIVFTKSSWASIVSSMSLHGEADGGFAKALAFHDTPKV